MGKLRAFTAQGGKVRSIPIQIDALPDETGVRPLGVPRADDPFAEGAEIIFMAEDAGSTPIAKGSGMQKGQWVEVNLGSVNRQESRYIYLGANEHVYVSNDYVSYDQATDRVVAMRYTMESHPGYPALHGELYGLRGSGRSSDLVFSRGEFIADLKILSFIPIARTKRNGISQLLGHRDGALRVIRRVESVVNVLPGFNAKTLADYLYYPSSMESPIAIEFPLPPMRVIAEGNFNLFVEYHIGSPYYARIGPEFSERFDLDGLRDAREKDADGEPTDAFYLGSDSSGVLALTRPSRELALAGMESRLYLDDEGKDGFGRIGFSYPLPKFRRGRNVIGLSWHILQDGRPEALRECVARLNKRWEIVSVRSIKSSTDTPMD